MTQNPLDTGELFMFEILNPNPSSNKLKGGPKYFMKCEIEKEVHDLFMAATTAGMVLELQGRVVEQNAPLKGGELSVRAAFLCREAGFDEWAHNKLIDAGAEGNSPIADGVRWIYHICGIKSRKELDHFPAAKEKFLELSQEFYSYVPNA